jgi:hypothetical protein
MCGAVFIQRPTYALTRQIVRIDGPAPQLEITGSDGRDYTQSPAGEPTVVSTVARAGAGETILVVEDNDGVRAYAKSAIEELGYTVIEAGTAEEALRSWKTARASTFCSPTSSFQAVSVDASSATKS